MGKNKHKNKNVNFSNNKNINIPKKVEIDKTDEEKLEGIIRHEENFDVDSYKVVKENKKARMTDEELRDSIVNYKVPELDIPDFSHGKTLKGKDDHSEKSNLLDKLLVEEESKKKVKKNSKKDFKNHSEKQVELFDEKITNDKTQEDKTEKEPKNKNENQVKKAEEVDLAERAKKKAEIAAQTGGVKTATRDVKFVKKESKNAKPKKKRLKVGKLISLLMILTIIIFAIFFGIKILIPYISNLNMNKIRANAPDEFGIGDYTEAPLTNYCIYKTIPDKIRGVYISEYTIASESNVDKWIKICKESELNALVINVKNDDGLISFEVDYEDAHNAGADANRTIKDPAELCLKLKQNGIWPIARIVSFKDPYLAKNRSDLALKDKNGNVLAVKSGSHYENWVNPYNRDLWDYVVNVSKCALDVGFKEIQYDYIRFGTGTEMANASFGFDSDTKTKRDIIIEFSKYAKDQISAYGGYLAADVFGTIITSNYDAEIVGQNYLEMGKIYDFLCPMIYPSHYADGSLGVTYPDLDPYSLVKKAMEASNEVLSAIPEGEHKAVVRAWLQDFTAPWIAHYQTYGPTQIRQQKQGVYDSGNVEWLLWNASNKYSTGGLD